jgi:hypothetical protein
MTCIWFELLSRIPWPGLRLRCCARHAEGCPRCLRESEAREAPPLLISADRLPASLDLWPGVKQGIEGWLQQPVEPGAVSLPARRSWRWAYAAAILTLLLLAGFWIISPARRSAPQPGPSASRPALQTRLCSAKVADQPARVFQVQSRNPDRTIFWIAKNDKRS